MLFTIVLAGWVAATAVVAGDDLAQDRPERSRVDPAGIPGALVLSGRDVPASALQSLLRLGNDQRIVVLRGSRSGERAGELVARLLRHAEEFAYESFEIVRVDRDAAHVTEALSTATAVWIAAENSADAETILTDPVRRAMLAAASRGAAIGASGTTAARLASHHRSWAADDSEKTEASRSLVAEGLGLLPDAIVALVPPSNDEATPLDELVGERRGAIGWELDDDAALVVRGRRISVVGDGGVRIVLPRCEWRAEHVVTLKGREAAADLTALRLSAIDRLGPRFPSGKPPSPRVERGTLIVIGGGGMPKGIVERFVDLAGGDEARIVVLPTALPDPLPARSGIAEAFRKAGAGKVTVLPGRTREDVDGEKSLSALREATGLWFGGGRQWRFADAYLGTKALELMHGVLKRGGVIMGSSAGASIQADYLARANPLGNRDIMAEGYERGLGFLKGVAIDQHFAQRRRFADMTKLVERHPQLLGIGVDEGTALIVRGQVGEVVGKSEVHFYDRTAPVPDDGPDHVSLPAGSTYDLVERKVLEKAEPSEAAPAR